MKTEDPEKHNWQQLPDLPVSVITIQTPVSRMGDTPGASQASASHPSGRTTRSAC